MRILFEPHFHTKETSSCAHVPAATAIAAMQKAGYGGVAVTDHYRVFDRMFAQRAEQAWCEKIDCWAAGYRAARDAALGTDFKVICGMEISFEGSPNDYLVYGVDPDFLKNYPELYKMTPETFFAFAEEHGLFFAQAHPFRNYCSRANPDFLHGLEVYNGNIRHDSQNDLALELAEKAGLRQIAGSDYHELEDLGTGGIYLGRLPADTRDFAKMLLTGEYDGLYANKL
ncbi:MAG: PHP domain-containing protein [Oscillospiraceae bacterium]|nr:PHP domain-containing protein [Oscillospiraceae bacterium]